MAFTPIDKHTLTVTRYSAGSVDPIDGIFVDGATSTFTIDCELQPGNGADLEYLPEGQRLAWVKAILCAEQLIASDPNTGVRGDRVSINGYTWEVKHIEDVDDFQYPSLLKRKQLTTITVDTALDLTGLEKHVHKYHRQER